MTASGETHVLRLTLNASLWAYRQSGPCVALASKILSTELGTRMSNNGYEALTSFFDGRAGVVNVGGGYYEADRVKSLLTNYWTDENNRELRAGLKSWDCARQIVVVAEIIGDEATKRDLVAEKKRFDSIAECVGSIARDAAPVSAKPSSVVSAADKRRRMIDSAISGIEEAFEASANGAALAATARARSAGEKQTIEQALLYIDSRHGTWA